MADQDSGDLAGAIKKAGFVAIVGRPNVGKSTLLNHLVGQKISITSRKAQTTRHRINGILTTDHAQFVFVDTPGFQTKHRSALNQMMNRTVSRSLTEVDAVIFVVEALRFGPADRQVLALLPAEIPVILAINKIDRVTDKAELFKFGQQMAAEREFAAVVPVSAEKELQLKPLLEEIERFLPEQSPLYAEDELTDRNERFLAAEIVREKIFRLLGDEVPYSTSVVIEKFEQEGHLRRIFAAVMVDKANQKPIILGEKGAKMKQIATDARIDMERLFGGKVYLEVWVKVKSGWADDEATLRRLGYES